MSTAQAFREFAQTWLRRDLTATDGIKVPSSVMIPTALREFYQTCGGIPELTRAHNQLLAPADIEVVDAHHIFYDENQCVVRWAFRDADRANDDPVVYQGVTLDNGYEWHSEDMVLSDWLQLMSLWQLVNGGYASGAYASGIPEGRTRVESHFPRVGGHVDGSTRFYGIPGQLICLSGPDTVPSVHAAGSTPADFAMVSSKLGFNWDYSCENE
jgi:hypothetical protein